MKQSCSEIFFLFSLLCSLILFFPLAAAQDITLSAPASPLSLPEGDDFATQILQNPWDMNERRDIGWEQEYTGHSIGVADGIWQGQSTLPAYVLPLFHGYNVALWAESLSGDKSLPKMGHRYPINASKYSFLSFNMKHSDRSSMYLYWSSRESGKDWPDGSNRLGFGDSPFSGYRLYSFDLATLSEDFDLTTSVADTQGSWNGNIVSLRIDPSLAEQAGALTQFDWIRLVDPNSAPTVTFSWTANSSLYNTIILYLDSNAEGYDGIPIFRTLGVGDPQTYNLKSAMLPPGSYYFYLAGNPLDAGPVVYSNYSAPLSIVPAPRFYFTSPSAISGEEYASSVLNDPWDMNNVEDITNLRSIWTQSHRQFHNHSFHDGLFTATTDPPAAGNLETDANIQLQVNNDVPIDTRKYRYLSYRLQINESGYPTLADKISNGWVLRIVYWWKSFGQDGGTSRAHILYEGFNTYSVDLWQSQLVEPGGGKTFQYNPWISHLRIDPLETSQPTEFTFDNVSLHAEPRPDRQGVFRLAWTIEGQEGERFNVSLYRDIDNQGYDGELIATLNDLEPGNHSYDWDTSAIAAGQQLHIYGVVSNELNTARAYATVPLITGTYQPPLLPNELPSSITFSRSKIQPTRLKRKGGKVKFFSVIRHDLNITRAWVTIRGGALRKTKTINFKRSGPKTRSYSASWKAPANKTKKKKHRYIIRFCARATNNAQRCIGAGQVSVNP